MIALRLMFALVQEPAPAQMVEVDPIRCWWRTSSGAVRLGETFSIGLTCAALEADGSEWAETELATLRAKSPQACKVALRLLAQGARMQDFADEMRQEYAVAAHVVQRPDFAEGVRAVLIDKDNKPRWNPPTPEGVTDAMIDRLFDPLPPAEAWTPLGADA